MKCTNCGARLMETDQFCPKCGARAIKEKRCQGCGYVLRDGVKFCPECGRPVAASGNTHKVPDETVDIPIDAIERNILSETEAEIKADRKKEGAVRKTSVSDGAAGRSSGGRNPSSGRGVSRGAAVRSGTSRNTSSSTASSRGTTAGRATTHSGAASDEAAREMSARRSAEPRSGQDRRTQEEPVMRRKSAPPIPPQKKRPVYSEEDWEEEDWEEEDYEEEDEDWEDEDYEDYEEDDWDDGEGVDVITIMTAIVGCAVLIVVAVLGFNLYKQYMPKAYSDVAEQEKEGEEEEQQQEQGEEHSQDEGQEQESDQTIETETGAADRETSTLTVTSETVNVRDQPSTSGTTVLKKAHRGETYACYGSAGDGSWYEILLEDGTTGYVSGDYVSVE